MVAVTLTGLPARPEDARHREKPLAMIALELTKARPKLRDDVVDLVPIHVTVRQNPVGTPFLIVARDVRAGLQLLERIEQQVAQRSGHIVIRPRRAH